MSTLRQLLTPGNCFLLAASITFGRLLRQNPIILGRPMDEIPKSKDFQVVQSQLVLDRILEKHEKDLGDDFAAYRNHCFRVFTLTLKLLDGKVNNKEIDVLAMAIAYHDMSLWVGPDLVENHFQASTRLVADQEPLKVIQGADEEAYVEDLIFDAKAIGMARTIIESCFRIWFYGGSEDVDDRLVNAVRVADWADTTLGLVKFDLWIGYLAACYEVLPALDYPSIFWQRIQGKSASRWQQTMQTLRLVRI